MRDEFYKAFHLAWRVPHAERITRRRFSPVSGHVLRLGLLGLHDVWLLRTGRRRRHRNSLRLAEHCAGDIVGAVVFLLGWLVVASVEVVACHARGWGLGGVTGCWGVGVLGCWGVGAVACDAHDEKRFQNNGDHETGAHHWATSGRRARRLRVHGGVPTRAAKLHHM